MVTEGLNKIAITLGKQLRDAMDAELVELDVAVAQSQHEYDTLVKQTRDKNEETNKLWKKRDNKVTLLQSLEGDLRELSRPRSGFPYLDDVAYETRMHELRVQIQGATEEMTKRASWSE